MEINVISFHNLDDILYYIILFIYIWRYAKRKYKTMDKYFGHSQNQICDHIIFSKYLEHKLNLVKDGDLSIYRISSMRSKQEERWKFWGNASTLHDF